MPEASSRLRSSDACPSPCKNLSSVVQESEVKRIALLHLLVFQQRAVNSDFWRMMECQKSRPELKSFLFIKKYGMCVPKFSKFFKTYLDRDIGINIKYGSVTKYYGKRGI
jgi:hypothetical protein